MPKVDKTAKAGLENQLELFSLNRRYEYSDPIRTNGQETLARTLPPNGEARWRQTGQLHALLLEAEEKTKDEMIELTQQFRNQGMTPQQAHDRAWEMVREEYILIPPES